MKTFVSDHLAYVTVIIIIKTTAKIENNNNFQMVKNILLEEHTENRILK